MHEMVSTDRGGAGNVQNYVVVDSGSVRPRSKSLGMISTNSKKKIKGSALSSRPSTASTTTSNASSECYELQDSRVAPSVTGTSKKLFNQYAPINLNTPSTTPTPSVMTPNGPKWFDHGQNPTPNQPQRLAISSAPPVKPVWKLQYQKPQQQPESSRHPEKTAKESILHDKKTGKGKWWKRSKKGGEEYAQIEHAHTDQRVEPLRRHVHEIATNNLTPKEAAPRHHPPIPTPHTDGIPRIPMRNPQIPSHVSPEQDPRSLSPAESQILDEVRMLAESKAHKNGHFNMHDLEEILLQTRHRHQNTPAAYDHHSSPAQPTSSQLSQFPLKPSPPTLPIPWHPSLHLQTLLNQEQQHVPTREHPERLHHQRETMMDGESIHLSASSAHRIQTRDHHPHAAPSSGFYSNPSPVYRIPSSTFSDENISEYSSVMSLERDSQSISSRSLKTSRRDRQDYKQPNEWLSPAMHATVHTKNVVKQGSDSVIAYHDSGAQEYNHPSDAVSELHRRQLALTVVHEEKNFRPVVADEGEGRSWSLDPVHEEDGDGLYFIEDEEPYSSFIDL